MDTKKVPPTLANASVGGTSTFILFVYPVHPKPLGQSMDRIRKTAEGLPTFYLGAFWYKKNAIPA